MNKMTIEERIEKASARVDHYWNKLSKALECNNEADVKYWMSKWASSAEIYEIITGKKWSCIKKV
jgi:hypothetical protein